MTAAIEDSHLLGTEQARAFLLGVLSEAPLVDERGRMLEVIVRRRRPQRSDDEERAFRLMHIFINTLAKVAGCTPEQMRYDLREAILPMSERLNRITGEIVYEPMSTKDLSFDSEPTLSHFISEVQRIGSQIYNVELKSNREPQMLQHREVG